VAASKKIICNDISCTLLLVIPNIFMRVLQRHTNVSTPQLLHSQMPRWSTRRKACLQSYWYLHNCLSNASIMACLQNNIHTT